MLTLDMRPASGRSSPKARLLTVPTQLTLVCPPILKTLRTENAGGTAYERVPFGLEADQA